MKWITSLLFVLLGLECFSQANPSVRLGIGTSFCNNIIGGGGNNEIIWSFNKSFSYGLNLGYFMSSDKELTVSEVGAYNHNSVLFGNMNGYYKVEFLRDLKLILNFGGGLRHINATQILINSNYELFPSNDFSTGIGIKVGIGLDYQFSDNYLIGVQYFHDFYKDGFDYLGLSFGISLNLN